MLSSPSLHPGPRPASLLPPRGHSTPSSSRPLSKGPQMGIGLHPTDRFSPDLLKRSREPTRRARRLAGILFSGSAWGWEAEGHRFCFSFPQQSRLCWQNLPGAPSFRPPWGSRHCQCPPSFGTGSPGQRGRQVKLWGSAVMLWLWGRAGPSRVRWG